MKIVVLAGGLSPERDVSLSSGALIANALIQKGHQVALVDVYCGCPKAPSFIEASSAQRYAYEVPEKEPNLMELQKESGMGQRLIGDGVLEACHAADLVFLALHGDIGENGKIQAVLDTMGIAYTGSSYIGSLLAMDKDLSKQIMQRHQIVTPAWQVVSVQEALQMEVILPCVVKPCSCGSSVGISVVATREEYQQAVSYAAQYEDTIIIEEKIEGREFSVGILEGEALPAIEIIPRTGFYDYKNKYQPGLTEEVCPADIPEAVEQYLRQEALRVHQVLRLGFYSRVDFILNTQGAAYCLEANALPGMTPTSLLPREAAAAGISYETLCEKIALDAWRRAQSAKRK